MTDEQRRAKRRTKDARRRARRRARKLGLPIPEFPGLSKGGRPPGQRLSPEERHRRQLESHRLSRERKDPGLVARREERARRAEERKRLAQERVDWREHARERRLEQYRQQARRWRANNPDRKRAYDHAYEARRIANRAANPDAKAVHARRRSRYYEANRETIIATETARRHLLVTCAQVLREQGIIPRQQWGFRIDYPAVLQMARELGLLDD